MKNTLTVGMPGSGKTTLSKFYISEQLHKGKKILILDCHKEFSKLTSNIKEYSFNDFVQDNFRILPTEKICTVSFHRDYKDKEIVDDLITLVNKAIANKFDLIYLNEISSYHFLENLDMFMDFKEKINFDVEVQSIKDMPIDTVKIRYFFNCLYITRVPIHDIDFYVKSFGMSKHKLIKSLEIRFSELVACDL